MKVVVLYHPQSDQGRPVEEFAHDFKSQKSRSLDLVSLETKEGSQIAELYDIMQYPAIVVLQDDGQYVKTWEGLPLPMMDEVVSYSS